MKNTLAKDGEMCKIIVYMDFNLAMLKNLQRNLRYVHEVDTFTVYCVLYTKTHFSERSRCV